VTEPQLTLKTRKSLEQRGAAFFKIHGGQFQRGVPDLLGCYRSIFIAIEMKLPGKERTLTDNQAMNLRKVRKAGGIARVCTSVTQANRILDQIDRKLDGN